MKSALFWNSLQFLLAALFACSAVAKCTDWPSSLLHRERLGVPPWLWRATGWAQGAGIGGLLIGYAYPIIALWAALWLILIMLGALIAHLRVRDAREHYATVCLLLGLTLVIAWVNWRAL